MSDKKTNQELSISQASCADERTLEERQKTHRFMTTEEAQEWNARRGLKPLSPNHWMAKAMEQGRLNRLEKERLERLQFLATGWKRLARKYSSHLWRLRMKGLID